MSRHFVCDVHIPPRLTNMLRAEGFEATHAFEINCATADDRVLSDFAKEKRAIVISKDRDFVALAALHGGPPIIHVRLGNCGNDRLIARFFASLSEILDKIDSGRKVVELR